MPRRKPRCGGARANAESLIVRLGRLPLMRVVALNAACAACLFLILATWPVPKSKRSWLRLPPILKDWGAAGMPIKGPSFHRWDVLKGYRCNPYGPHHAAPPSFWGSTTAKVAVAVWTFEDTKRPVKYHAHTLAILRKSKGRYLVSTIVIISGSMHMPSPTSGLVVRAAFQAQKTRKTRMFLETMSATRSIVMIPPLCLQSDSVTQPMKNQATATLWGTV